MMSHADTHPWCGEDHEQDSGGVHELREKCRIEQLHRSDDFERGRQPEPVDEVRREDRPRATLLTIGPGRLPHLRLARGEWRRGHCRHASSSPGPGRHLPSLQAKSISGRFGPADPIGVPRAAGPGWRWGAGTSTATAVPTWNLSNPCSTLTPCAAIEPLDYSRSRSTPAPRERLKRVVAATSSVSASISCTSRSLRGG